LEARVWDLEAVIKATQLEQLDLIGEMWSGPVAVAYAVKHPDKIRHLLLLRTYARAADITSRDRWQPLVDLARANWRMAAEVFGRIDAPEADTRRNLFQLLGQGVDGADAAKWLEQQYEIDVTDLLSGIDVPTLVISSRSDRSIPLRLGRDLASRINGARFVELDQRRPELDEAILHIVSEFISDAVRHDESTRATAAQLRTVLFTDLVGHTEMMSRLGDERGRAVLREQETITRNVLKQHGGTEVKTMGDGFMASFGSVTKAVECAIALQRASAEREGEPLSVRVGLNAGEPIEEEGDLFGATVILASRIAAKAEGGEILVADTVRGLCSGKGFLFADRGEFVAKGFEEPVRVYEVSWRG
jgi:class 3 adenylate cyclase